MMKLSFIGDLSDHDVRFAVEHGFDGIEMLYHGFKEAERDKAASQRQVFEDNGLEPCAFGLWRVNFLDPDSRTREANIRQLRLCIDHAADVGCPIVYTGGGSVDEGNDDRNVAEFAEVFPPIIEYAGAKRVKLGVYFGHEGNMFRSMAVWERVKDSAPALGMKLDPMGLIRNLQEDPVAVLYKYGDRLCHFHIKDRLDVADTWVQPAVGQGDIPWGKVMAMLYHHQYDGYISVEPHGPVWGKEEHRHTGILLAKKHVELFMVRSA